MKKINYEAPEIKYVLLSTEDVLRSSFDFGNEGENEGDGEDLFY